MGYEVKIYAGEHNQYDTLRENEADYFAVIGMVDLHKPGYDSLIYKLCAEESAHAMFPAVSAYLRNGNEREDKDCYDKLLRAIPIELAIDALTKDREDQYWRFDLALEFLVSAKRNYKGDRLRVVLYGY